MPVPAPDPRTEDPAWAVVSDRLGHRLRRAMNCCLSERQRQVLAMELEGMRPIDIARELGITKVSVFWIEKRAAARLRRYFGLEENDNSMRVRSYNAMQKERKHRRRTSSCR
jgi:DNA-directed RNA polymerase specialized sigma24 family protein